MIKIENTVVFGWEAAIRGARNPMNSWDKSDSDYCAKHLTDINECKKCQHYNADGHFCDNVPFIVGPNDRKLLQSLANAGPDHGKFLRMITVSLDIAAPLYWWKEFDTYKVGTVANSCSTMHKIHAKEFTLDDFSTDKLSSDGVALLTEHIIPFLEDTRKWYITDSIYETTGLKKQYWYDMIQILPTSYNQRRTVLLNYQVLKSMYHARKHHKLDEWREFCEWIRVLPYSELIIGGDE